MKRYKLLIILVVLMTIVATLLTTYIVVSNEDYRTYNHNSMMELKYQNIKYQLVEETDKYINSVAPSSSLLGIAVITECIEFSIDPSFVLAQGQVESHYGTKGLARKTNSVFNIYAYDYHTYDQIYSNGKFDDPNNSVRPYLKLLTKRYLINKTEYELMIEYVDIEGNRYATDQNYETKLVEKYEHIINNTKIDSLYNELLKYKILMNR